MRCFIEIFNETKETAKTFGGALSDLVSPLVFLVLGFRADVSDTVRHAVLLQPELAFNFAKQWLETTMNKPIDSGTVKNFFFSYLFCFAQSLLI
jgi:hypothetical protein